MTVSQCRPNVSDKGDSNSAEESSHAMMALELSRLRQELRQLHGALKKVHAHFSTYDGSRVDVLVLRAAKDALEQAKDSLE